MVSEIWPIGSAEKSVGSVGIPAGCEVSIAKEAFAKMMRVPANNPRNMAMRRVGSIFDVSFFRASHASSMGAPMPIRFESRSPTNIETAKTAAACTSCKLNVIGSGIGRD